MLMVKKKKSKFREFVTGRNRRLIYRMLFGPFDDSWYLPNGILDNRDTVIANRLGLGRSTVSQITNTYIMNRVSFLESIRSSDSKYSITSSMIEYDKQHTINPKTGELDKV